MSLYYQSLSNAVANELQALQQQNAISFAQFEHLRQLWMYQGVARAQELERRYPDNRLNTEGKLAVEAREIVLDMMRNAGFMCHQPNMVPPPQYGGYGFPDPYGPRNSFFQQPTMFNNQGSYFRQPPQMSGNQYGGGMFGGPVAPMATAVAARPAYDTGPSLGGRNNLTSTSMPQQVAPVTNVGVNHPPNPPTAFVAPRATRTNKRITSKKLALQIATFEDGNSPERIDVVTGNLAGSFLTPLSALAVVTNLPQVKHQGVFIKISYWQLEHHVINREAVIKLLKQLNPLLVESDVTKPEEEVKRLIKIKQIIDKSTRGLANFIEKLIVNEFNMLAKAGSISAVLPGETPDSIEAWVDTIDELITYIDENTNPAIRAIQTPKFLEKVTNMINMSLAALVNYVILDPSVATDFVFYEQTMADYSKVIGGQSYTLEQLPALIEAAKGKRNSKPTQAAAEAAAIVTDIQVDLQEHLVFAKPATIGYSDLTEEGLTGPIIGFSTADHNLRYFIAQHTRSIEAWSLYLKQEYGMNKYTVAQALSTDSNPSRHIRLIGDCSL